MVFAVGTEVEVDMNTDILKDLSTGKEYSLKPLGEVGFHSIKGRF